MNDDCQLVQVTPSGRMSIPAKQRRMLGLQGGGMVVVEVSEGELRVRPVRDVVRALQDEVLRTLGNGGTTVDAFVAERHAEAARDGSP